MSVPYWRLSAFYACYFAILGAFLPFWSLYLQQSGFNASEIGQLTALLVATKIIAPNLWGWIADKSSKRLRLIRYTTFLSALLFAGFLYQVDYAWYAYVTVGFSFFWNASLPQFEAVTLLHLNATPQHYSRIRLWGSVGFIAAVLGIGRSLDYFSIAHLPVIISIIMVLNWMIAVITPEAKSIPLLHTQTKIWQVIGRTEVIAFLLVYLLLQISHGPYYVFYSVYLKQHGYTATVTGLFWALGVFSEIIMFILFARLVKWFSLRTLLLGSLSLSVLRWTIIAYEPDIAPLLVFAQLLHAATFGVAHVVAIQLLSQYFGDHHQGIGQALYASISFGIGGMLGSLYSGYFWDSLGAMQVFVIAALASGLALIIAYLAVGKTKKPV
ncbi:MFS transporter [Methylomonas sp. AM2-LC]|uniref:MFS transporter n=1 Tax=Methylomonas sp. AM2-LC TaxID=3153301 RepID=UPI003262DB5E